MSWTFPTHPGEPIAPHDLWAAWNLAPWLVAPLALMALIYFAGLRRVWQRAGLGHGLSVRRCLCFLGALLALVVALMSPLEAMSGVLFSAHMVQHLLLLMVAAPLLVLSDFPLALLWTLPRRWGQMLGQGLHRWPGWRAAWRVLSSPLSAWLLFALALWAWHVPALYEAALRHETLHAWEHQAYLATALLFWWILLKHAEPSHIQYGLAVPYLFLTALQSGILGALMTFTDKPWYAYYAPLVAAWGLTPLQDQQLAGLIMWLPGGAVFTLLTIAYFAAWLRALEQRSARWQYRNNQ